MEIVERLDAEGMLPAIVFIFSRAACDDAARQCVDLGLRLTTSEERLAIRTIVEDKVDALSDAWGVSPEVIGKTVWVEKRLER